MNKYIIRYITGLLLISSFYNNSDSAITSLQPKSIKLARRGGGGGGFRAGGGSRMNRGGFDRGGSRRGNFRQQQWHRQPNRWQQHRRRWSNGYYGNVYVDGGYWPNYWPAATTAAVIGTTAAAAAASQDQNQQDSDDLRQEIRNLQSEIDELRESRDDNNY
ncbi:MAG: hypothetical protein WCD44_01850 [Candidatus Babeliales bacterium]